MKFNTSEKFELGQVSPNQNHNENKHKISLNQWSIRNINFCGNNAFCSELGLMVKAWARLKEKNPAYGWQKISQPMRIVGLI